jgi:NADH dehydrogenase
VIGSGQQLVQPVLVGDVAAALAAAIAGGPAGTYDLAGPEWMTLDELVTVLNPGRDVRIRHLPGPLARAAARVRPSGTPALVDLLLRDSVGETEPAVAAFGLRLTSLREKWS